ncbi:hypothetical protein QM637_05795 [Pantoea allii]|uniref:hypothetical protein n=1 Tax=Pantoea allii TaxID=574096 RepID=UPI0024B7F443|nr:hypothetical protein [Pantoea allii]MDJ0035347.1 hypothetical protein [Pantoea allii]
MKTHESQAPKSGSKGQRRRGAEPLMQVHENRYTKCAGVAGLRARATGNTRGIEVYYRLLQCQ